jgi:hypothetical protein
LRGMLPASPTDGLAGNMISSSASHKSVSKCCQIIGHQLEVSYET